MDFTLSSTVLQNLGANQITSDNTTIFSSLYVSGTSMYVCMYVWAHYHIQHFSWIMLLTI